MLKQRMGNLLQHDNKTRRGEPRPSPAPIELVPRFKQEKIITLQNCKITEE